MTINIHREEVLTLAEAAKILPRPVHFSTILRWSQCGYGGVRLETVRIGRTLCTSREALQRFVDRLSDQQTNTSPSTKHRAAKAMAELERMGI